MATLMSTLRRTGAAAGVVLLLGASGLACSDTDDGQGQPLERNSTENPNGGGMPTEDEDAGTEDGGDNGGNDDGGTTDSVAPGQPNSGENDTGQNEPTQNIDS